MTLISGGTIDIINSSSTSELIWIIILHLGKLLVLAELVVDVLSEHGSLLVLRLADNWSLEADSSALIWV